MVRPGDLLVNSVTGHRYEIVHTGDDTSGALLEMLAEFPPGGPEPPDHFHPHQEETFDLLEGVLELRVAGVRRQLRAGQTLIIPPGTRHAMWTTPLTTARVRWQTKPALRSAEFFAATVKLAAAGRIKENGRPDLLDSALLLSTYHAEFQLPTPPAALQRVMFGILAAIARVAGRTL